MNEDEILSDREEDDIDADNQHHRKTANDTSESRSDAGSLDRQHRTFGFRGVRARSFLLSSPLFDRRPSGTRSKDDQHEMIVTAAKAYHAHRCPYASLRRQRQCLIYMTSAFAGEGTSR